MPVHGYKIGENYWAGQMVKYTCDTGYRLEGPTNRMCLENGNWSDVVPKCNEVGFYVQLIIVLLTYKKFILLIFGNDLSLLRRKIGNRLPTINMFAHPLRT